MDLYNNVSQGVSKLVTQQYSTSFSMSTRLFDTTVRPAVYAVYGLVRIADEIVDTYRGNDAGELLDRLEGDVYKAIERGYDANPVVHAFALTAQKYGIEKSLVQPFFESMAMDLEPSRYTDALYQQYIYGSAEVVGLMCLKVFCDGDGEKYEALLPGARALGSAYQKVNFLRDIATDYKELGRLYFPNVEFDTFNDEVKIAIIRDIEKDFSTAKSYIEKLPSNSKKAVSLSYFYYSRLLDELKKTPAQQLKLERVRVSSVEKITLLLGVITGVVRV